MLFLWSFSRSEPVDLSRTSNIPPGSPYPSPLNQRPVPGGGGGAAAAAAAAYRHSLEPSAAGSSPGSSSIESMIKQRKPSGLKTGSSHEMLLKNIPFEVKFLSHLYFLSIFKFVPPSCLRIFEPAATTLSRRMIMFSGRAVLESSTKDAIMDKMWL